MIPRTLATLPFLLSLAASLPAQAPAPARTGLETTVSLGVAAQLTATRVTAYPYPSSSTPFTQGFDPSAAVLATLRQSHSTWLGYTLNLGYTRSTQQNRQPYNYSGTNTASFPIPANIYEVSLAYTVQKRISPRVQLFTEVGGGGLAFLPVHRGADARDYVPGRQLALVPSELTRPLGIAGGGLTVALSPHFGLRGEYRGLLYKNPDYGSVVGRAITVTSQPTLSLVYRFGR